MWGRGRNLKHGKGRGKIVSFETVNIKGLRKGLG